MRQLRLKDLGRWSSGGTPPRDSPEHWEGDIPWLSAKDIDSTRLRTPTAFVTRAAAHRHSKLVPPGALLLIVRGMALAHGLPVVQVDREVAFNQDLRAVVCNPDVDPRFAYYSLIGHRWKLDAHIDRAAHGTARVVDSIQNERIAVPDLATQRQLADFLDHECSQVRKLADELESYDEGLVEPALARFAELTSQLPGGRVSYRFELQLGKMLDASRIDEADTYPYLRNTNVQWDRIDLRDLKRMTFSGEERRKFELRPGDLLVCEGGQPGRSAVWPGEMQECYFQKALIRARPRAADLTRFLMWALRLAGHRGDFAADGTGSTILHLPAERLAATRIPICPLEVQERIVDEVDRVAARARQVQAEVAATRDRLDEYRDALITEAVTGQLDVTRAEVLA